MWDGADQHVDLHDEPKQKILLCLCSCMAPEELEREGKFKITEAWIDANHHVVEKRSEERYQNVLGTRRRGNAKRNGYVAPAGETLLKQNKIYLPDSFDLVNLGTKHSKVRR